MPSGAALPGGPAAAVTIANREETFELGGPDDAGLGLESRVRVLFNPLDRLLASTVVLKVALAQAGRSRPSPTLDKNGQ